MRNNLFRLVYAIGYTSVCSVYCIQNQRLYDNIQLINLPLFVLGDRCCDHWGKSL